MTDLEKNYREIIARIAVAKSSGGSASEVTLIAVSKKQPVEKIEALYHLGQRDFGENYAQEMVAKAEELNRRGCADIRWHFIGHLQTNKAKLVAPHVFAVHSIDSEKVARALANAWPSDRAGKLPIFLEVNISREESKSGVSIDEVPSLASSVALITGLELQGLMCVPSADENDALLAKRFDDLQAAEAALNHLSRRKLSMGMSGDFELAIRHGATHVRIGTALFGERTKR